MSDTTALAFVPASKLQRKARIAIIGPTGCGKSMTSILMASGMGNGGAPRIAAVDTEHGSLSLYSERAAFDVLRLEKPFHPNRYRAALEAAIAGGYDVAIIDSLSHEWMGPGGIMTLVDEEKVRSKNPSGFAAWNGPSQLHEEFVQFIVSMPMHVIATFRSKMEYLQSTENGKTTVKKVGLAAITRDNVEYEFDLVIEMDLQHRGHVTKSRIPDFADRVISLPGRGEGQAIVAWLSTGAVDQTASTTPDPLAPAEAPVARGLSNDDKAKVIALAKTLPQADRDAFYGTFLFGRGFRGNGFAGMWADYVARATADDLAAAITWLTERQPKPANGDAVSGATLIETTRMASETKGPEGTPSAEDGAETTAALVERKLARKPA